MKSDKLSKKQLLVTTIVCFILSIVMFFSIAFVDSALAVLLFFLLSVALIISAIVFLIKFLKKSAEEKELSKQNRAPKNSYYIPVYSVNAQPNAEVQKETNAVTQKEINTKIQQNELTKELNVGIKTYKLKYSYDKVKIVGSNYIENINEIKSKLNPKSAIILQSEPTNEYDDKAVAVYFYYDVKQHIKHKIGYLSKDSHCYNMFNDYKKKGGEVRAVLDTSGELLLKIGFYLPTQKESMESIIFKPISTNSNEVQENLELCEVGDECDIEYDYDKEKNILYCDYGKIGTIPKKIDEIIEASSEYYFCIDSLITVETDFEDKIEVSIIMYYE